MGAAPGHNGGRGTPEGPRKNGRREEKRVCMGGGGGGEGGGAVKKDVNTTGDMSIDDRKWGPVPAHATRWRAPDYIDGRPINDHH